MIIKIETQSADFGTPPSRNSSVKLTFSADGIDFDKDKIPWTSGFSSPGFEIVRQPTRDVSLKKTVLTG